MANLISAASGNWTSSSTWRVAATGAGAVLTSRTTAQSVPLSPTASSTFTITNGETINGILVHLERVVTTGTITLALAAGGVDLTTRTINAADLPDGKSWVCFNIANLTSSGLSTYSVRLSTSASNSVRAYTNGTSNNWSHILRTTTSAAPISGDNLWVIGEQTGAGTGNAYTVTMDSTAAVGYGKVEVNKGGTLAYGTSASTNYRLIVDQAASGGLEVFAAGTFTIGTSAAPIPTSSTAELYFNTTSLGGEIMQVWKNGTFLTYGPTKDLASTLSATTSANSISGSLVSTPSNWKLNDTIIYAPTARSTSQYDAETLTADVTGSTITHTSTSFQHDGVGRTAGEIINVTQAIKIHGTSVALASRIELNTGAIVDCNYTEFYFLGASSGCIFINAAVAPESVSAIFTNCSFRDCVTTAAIFFMGQFMSGLTASNCVAYNVGLFISNSTLSGSCTFNNNTLIRLASGAFVINNSSNVITNNKVSAVPTTAYSIVGQSSVSQLSIGTFTNNIAHACSTGLGIGSFHEETSSIINCDFWRNTVSGIAFTGSVFASSSFTVSGCTMFGNTTNLTIDKLTDTKFINCIFDSDSLASTAISINAQNYLSGVIFENCQFGPTLAAALDLSITDVALTSTGHFHNFGFRNCLFTGTIDTNGFSSTCRMFSQNHNQVDGAYRSWGRYSTIQEDTTFYRTSSPASRITVGTGIAPGPSFNTNIKSEIPVGSVAVSGGDTVTFSVYVRKSVIGDGTAYNGNQPRLILKSNSCVGITTDTVLDTATGSHDGAFAILTGSTPAATNRGIIDFVVDCDGTAGWITVDDAGAI